MNNLKSDFLFAKHEYLVNHWPRGFLVNGI